MTGIRAAAALPRRPRRGRGLDHAVLPLAAARPRLRRRRLPRRRPAVRHARRLRRDAGDGPRPRHQGDRRRRAQPHLDRAPVVPGRAGRGTGRPGARALRVPRRHRPRRRQAAEQLGLDLRRPGVDPRSTDGQWYLHLFDVSQPDLNWWNPEVHDEFETMLRFWLDRGVDGFRVDVAHGLFKHADLVPARASPPAAAPDVGPARGARGLPRAGARSSTSTTATGWPSPRPAPAPPRRWRATSARTSSSRRSTSPGSRHRGRRPRSARSSSDTFDSVGLVGGSPTWVLSNHDVVRETTRYGGGEPGRARARAAALTMMALPGSAYVYQGEELGLEQVDVPPERAAGPGVLPRRRPGRPRRLPGADAVVGRRRRRTASGPGAGQPWLPQPADWAGLTVEAQQGDEGSTLAFFRRMLRLRREVRDGLPDASRCSTHAPGHLRVPARRPGVRGQLRLAPVPAARRGRRAAAQQRRPTRSTAGSPRTPPPGSAPADPAPSAPETGRPRRVWRRFSARHAGSAHARAGSGGCRRLVLALDRGAQRHLADEQHATRATARTARRSGTGGRSRRRRPARRPRAPAPAGWPGRDRAAAARAAGWTPSLARPVGHLLGDLVAEHRAERRDADRAAHRAEERDHRAGGTHVAPARCCSAPRARGSASWRRGRGRAPP